MWDIFSTTEWAQENWHNSKLGDTRRNKRVMELAKALLDKPNESLPCQISQWKDLKAAYRLLSSSKINHQSLQEEHWRNTVLKAKERQKTILFIQDTSELDYSKHTSSKDLGYIGNHGGKGIMFHTCLTVEYEKAVPAVLGLAYQYAWTRSNKTTTKHTETRLQTSKRWNEGKLWEQTLKQIGTPQDNWVNVGDRGNDIFTFIRFCKNNSWNYVIRAKHNRKITTQNGQQEKLFVWVKSLPQKAVKTIILNQQEIELSVSWEKIKIKTPKNGFKKSDFEEIEVWCIRCWQENNNLEWVLLTNMPILFTDEALERIEWYKSRWLIEEYHKCLKTGCNIEKRQLTTAQGLLSLLSLFSIIATKLIELKFLVRSNPEDKAKNAIPQLILQVICARFKLSEENVTLRQVWHKIANLGGFIGRKSDGSPGWQTLWKGWLRVLDMVAGAESLNIPKCG